MHIKIMIFIMKISVTMMILFIVGHQQIYIMVMMVDDYDDVKGYEMMRTKLRG